MKKQEVLQRMHEELFIGVVKDKTVEESLAHAEAYINGGITSLEISAQGANPTLVISTLKEKYKDKIIVGAGTVLEDVTARIVMLAGADYIAAPTYRVDVNTICNRYGVFYMPACFTSNEIPVAMEGGANIVKLFPGELIGVNSAKVLKAMYSGLEIIAAGGANLDNLFDWLDIDVWAVGVVLPVADLKYVTSESAKYVKKLKEYRNK